MAIGVVVVSDTAFKNKQTDVTGQVLINAIYQAFGSKETTLKYVPDSIDQIRATINELVSKEYELVLTAGGTGFSSRDVTPEAIKPMLQKEAMGLVVAMLTASLTITPMAALSRPVAGVINQTLVVTLPGSPKGAVENFNSIKTSLPHALKLLGGFDSRELHKARDHTCPHHHGHDGGPKFYGPAHRDRESPYPLIPFDDAIDVVLSAACEPVPIEVSLESSLNCVLANDIKSAINVPAFRASIVDGYAVFHMDLASSGECILPVSKVSLASSELEVLKPLTCTRITTGAPVPHGATAVVPVENTLVEEELDGEEVKIKIIASGVKPGDNIREIGSDIQLGQLVLPKNTVISSLGGEVGVLASLGITKVPVFRKPVVGVLSTGDEVVNSGEGLVGSQIWDANRPMLLANLRSWLGNENVLDLGILRDDADVLKNGFHDALSKVDVLFTSGGVSMGELDLIKPIIKSLGGDIKFGRVLMKPGKPMTFATLPAYIMHSPLGFIGSHPPPVLHFN